MRAYVDPVSSLPHPPPPMANSPLHERTASRVCSRRCALPLRKDALCCGPQRVRVTEIAMQDHHLVDQLLGRTALSKRLVEVANVGLGVAENGGRVVIVCVRPLVASDDDLGLERLDLLDASDPLHSLVV